MFPPQPEALCQRYWSSAFLTKVGREITKLVGPKNTNGRNVFSGRKGPPAATRATNATPAFKLTVAPCKVCPMTGFAQLLKISGTPPPPPTQKAIKQKGREW